MKLLVGVVGAVCLLASIGLIIYGLLMATDQINRAQAGIYAVAFGVLAHVMVQAAGPDKPE